MRFKPFLLIPFLIIITGCGNSHVNTKQKNTLDSVKEIEIEGTFVLSGLYIGNQNGYTLKNKFGEEVVIRGQRVIIPSVEHKFLFEEDFTVSLQQTTDEGQRVYYEGSYQTKQEGSEKIIIQCQLSDGEYSNPTINIEYLELNETFTVKGDDGSPDFELVKTDL